MKRVFGRFSTLSFYKFKHFPSLTLIAFFIIFSSLQASEDLKEDKESSLNRSVEKSPIILKIDELIEFIENSSNQKKDSGLKTLTSATTSTTTIKLKTLRCDDIQDAWGADDLKLEVTSDGNLNSYSYSMSTNDTWKIDLMCYFKKSLEIRLLEIDGVSKNDLLGTVTMNHGQASGNYTFNGKGANYLLTWIRL